MRRFARLAGSRRVRGVLLFVLAVAFLEWIVPVGPLRTASMDKPVWTVTPDGSRLACWAGGMMVSVFDSCTLEQTAQFIHSNATTAVPLRFSPDGRYLGVLVTL